MAEQRSEREVIAEAYSDEARNWIAPVQGFGAGIPWPIHLEAYDVYCKKWSRQTALINLKDRGCRGGFGVGELDEFVPGWRDRVSEMAKLKRERDVLRHSLRCLEDACEAVAAGRPQAAYDAMIAGGQADALVALDMARASARQTLESLPA